MDELERDISPLQFLASNFEKQKIPMLRTLEPLHQFARREWSLDFFDLKSEMTPIGTRVNTTRESGNRCPKKQNVVFN